MQNPLKRTTAQEKLFAALRKAGWTLPGNIKPVVGKAYQDLPFTVVRLGKGEVTFRSQFRGEGNSFLVLSYASYATEQEIDLESMNLVGVGPEVITKLIAERKFDTQLTPASRLLKALSAAGWDLEDSYHFVQNGITYILLPSGKGSVTFQAQGNSFAAIGYRDPTGKTHTLTPSPQGISPKAFAALVARAKLDD